MEQTKEPQRRDAWERLGWLWIALFYGALVMTSALALSDEELTGNARWVAIGLLLFLGVWRAALIGLGQDRVWSNARLGFPLMLVGLAAWYPLIFIHPIFYFLLAGIFPSLFIYMKIPLAIVLSLIYTVLVILGQAQGGSVSLGDPFVWGTAGAVLMGILLGVWINAIIGQSMHRRQLLEQLEAAQAQLAAAERREGALQERERLAREIHDTLSQGFTSIVMHLEAAEQALPEDLPTLRRHLDRARQTARDSLGQAREVVQDLRPDLLTEQSLPQAIERVSARWSEEHNILVTTTVTGNVAPLPPGMDVTLLRATQEALANVRKHAEATAVAVTLSYMGDVVVLDVQDDGAGLDNGSPSPFSGGFGLKAMRERVEQLGGTLLVESEPGEGTTLVIEMPVAEGQHAAGGGTVQRPATAHPGGEG